MVFNQLDIDKDGELNEDEFVKGCLKVCFVQIEWKLWMNYYEKKKLFTLGKDPATKSDEFLE